MLVVFINPYQLIQGLIPGLLISTYMGAKILNYGVVATLLCSREL